MRPIFTFLFFIHTSLFSFSQSNIQQPTSINSDGAAPNASAILDVQSTDKGILVPRMTTAQRLAIPSPAYGLLVFDTSLGNFYYNNSGFWVPLSDIYIAGDGIDIFNNVIKNIGDTNGFDDITTGSAAGGSLAGTYPNPAIAANAIGSAEITDGSITAADLNSMSAANGQALKWNGSAWAPGSISALQDADGNTKVQVEKNPNEDIIRFDLGGTENMVLRKNANGSARLELPDASGNNFIGQGAGFANSTGYNNTANGALALTSNTTGAYNTANGLSALHSNTTGVNNSANGSSALHSNTTGYNNTANGLSALLSNTTGYFNTADGIFALNSNTTGESNVAVGSQALYSNTVRSNLVAIGDGALYNNGVGATLSIHATQNTAIGSKALYSNTTGFGNTANGADALRLNTSGYDNTANGVNALRSNIGGNNNAANGAAALFSNTSGYYNTASGSSALYFNLDGFSNTATGHSSLYLNTIGDYNTAHGMFALYSNTGGNDNSALGFNALRLNTIGSDNVAIGNDALFSNTHRSNLVAVGDGALYNNGVGGPYLDEEAMFNTALGSKALYSNTAGAFNTASGTDALHFNTLGYENTANGYRALYSNIGGYQNMASGASALYSNIGGYQNTASGFGALSFNTGGNANTAVGASSGSADNSSNCTYIGYNADSDISSNIYTNSTALGSGSRITASAQVRIGNSTTGSIGGYQLWTNVSDGRYKNDVQENVPGLAFIQKLRPVTYHLDAHGLAKHLNEDVKDARDDQSQNVATAADIRARDEKSAFLETGFIAQEVEATAKAMGYEFSGVDAPKNETDLYGLRYASFVVPLVKAVQEQQTIIETQASEIEAQKVIIAALSAQLDKISAALQGAGIAVEKE